MSWFEARGGGVQIFLAQTASGVSLMISLAFQVSADSRGCLPGYELLGVFYATFDCQWCVTTQILPGLSSSVCSHLVCGKCLGKWLRALDLLVHLFLPGNFALQTCRFCVSLLPPFFFYSYLQICRWKKDLWPLLGCSWKGTSSLPRFLWYKNEDSESAFILSIS